MKSSAIFAIIVATAFTGCGKKENQSGQQQRQEAPLQKTFLKFDANVPYRQKILLSDDLVYLRDRDHTPALNYKAAVRDSEKLAESQRKDLLP